MSRAAVLSPQEREHAEAMVKARDLALRDVIHLDATDPIQVLISAAAKAIVERVPQGGRNEAVRIAQQQLERNVKSMLSRK